jgi:transposase InsO family protein
MRRPSAPETLVLLSPAGPLAGAEARLGDTRAPTRYLIRDRDAAYGHVITRRLRTMGIRDRPTAPRSPWQNGCVERLIGPIRRECVDHVVVFGETHLRRLLNAYSAYYNEARPHLSLGKDAPNHRSFKRFGRIVAIPALGGLHHQYCLI